MNPRLPAEASQEARAARYDEVIADIAAITEGEDDWICVLSTVCCELHGAFGHLQWTGFYRVVAPRFLAVGPYQGGHGCLRIDFDRGVCGAAARTREVQDVPDVEAFPGHIACSSATRSELVVPVVTPGGVLLAVLDLDSDDPAAFGPVDVAAVTRLCEALGRQAPAEVVARCLALAEGQP